MLEHQLVKKQSKKSPAEGIPGYTNEKKRKQLIWTLQLFHQNWLELQV